MLEVLPFEDRTCYGLMGKDPLLTYFCLFLRLVEEGTLGVRETPV
jgi:hypothetical protein